MKRREFVKSLAVAGGVTVTSGCFGSFKAVRWVYDLNKDISGNKFVQWLVFLGLCILPVYEIAGLIDLWILNSIEFWFGGGGSSELESDERVVELGPGETLWMKKDRAAGLLQMRYEGRGESVALTFEMDSDEAKVRMNDALVAVAREEAGSVIVSNRGGVLARFDAETVRAALDAHKEAGAAGAVQWAQVERGSREAVVAAR